MRRNKYGAKKITIDGITFDSQREGRRYQDLVLLQRAGRISGLQLQPEYLVEVNSKKIGKYKADFLYFDHDKKEEVVEDCKGFRTPVYRLKKKLVEALYGFKILET